MVREPSLRSILVGLLSSDSTGLLLIALIADVISADAKFNYWMAMDGKRVLGNDEILDVIGAYEDARARCLSEVQRFKSSANLEELEAALHQTLGWLQECGRERGWLE